MQEKRERYVLIDMLKGIAIIFVIIIHTDFFASRHPVYLLILNLAVPTFLMCSSFVLALRFFHRERGDMYRPAVLKKAFARLAVPMIVSYACYLLFLYICEHDMSPWYLLKTFVLARFGLGSYYYFIVIQFILLAPLILSLVKKQREKGLLILALISLVFELICQSIHLQKDIYKVLIFRYLPCIGCGFYLYGCLKVWNKQLKPWALALTWLAGFIYAVAPAFGYEFRLFAYPIWGKTSMVYCLYAFPILYCIFSRFLDSEACGRHWPGKILAYLGKASLHIMCAQMVYFMYKPGLILRIYDYSTLGKYAELGIDLFISIAAGLCFYEIETRISKALSSKKNA